MGIKPTTEEVITWLVHEFEDPDGFASDLGYTEYDAETQSLMVYDAERNLDMHHLASSFIHAFDVQKKKNSSEPDILSEIKKILEPEWLLGRVLQAYLGSDSVARVQAIRRLFEEHSK